MVFLLLILSVQSLWIVSDALLGLVRPDRSGEFRTDWYPELHTILGLTDVRLLLCDQRGGTAKSADCNDEPLLSVD